MAQRNNREEVLHIDNQSSQNCPNKSKLIASLLGYSLLVILPCIHIGVIQYLWTPNKTPVDKKECTCGCFDTIYKGSYESPPSTYKHVYFNATADTAKIWALTMLAVVALYETIKYLYHLFTVRRLRVTMFVLFASVVYSHYYSWWVYFGYYNDEFYKQWYHQLFFTATELASTCVVLNLCDLRIEATPRKLLAIFAISCLHIVVSSWDQFVANVILQRWKGRHQFFRDLGFMLPDLLHFVVPIYELRLTARHTGQPMRELINKFELIIIMSLVFVTSFIVKML